MIDMSKQDVKQLQIRLSVYEIIFGAPSYTQTTASTGEIVVAFMKARTLERQWKYLNHNMHKGRDLLKWILAGTTDQKNNRLIERIGKNLRKMGPRK